MNKHFLQISFILFFILLLISCRQYFGDASQPESIVQPVETKNNFVITSPKYAASYKHSESMNIKWLTSGSVEKINIKLFRKSAFQFDIANAADNNGSYNWKVPEDLSNSLHYILRIENTNNSNEYTLSERFIIED